ncbi:7-carboxy-7-deazaguanine synthase [Roseateles sp. MS654]|uniref:7-carboxy-7-deazaguanine synthase n=1 Tax=Roseateles sp. MS654 TaxID=3412685 RepID=UPI003C2FA18B
MTYAVKEMFYTLQGEGAQAGRAAVFCRFAGCNLWSGREQDRAAAICTFCDTDFVGTDGQGGGKFASADALAEAIDAKWPKDEHGKRTGIPYVVCTGGEPLLQLDGPLITALKAHGFEIAVETNGTQPAPEGLDWICVSPKADAEVVLTKGNELKLVYPQPLAMPERFANLHFDHFFLQPMDSVLQKQNTKAAIAYCMAHPQWKLSIQMHKVVGID